MNLDPTTAPAAAADQAEVNQVRERASGHDVREAGEGEVPELCAQRAERSRLAADAVPDAEGGFTVRAVPARNLCVPFLFWFGVLSEARRAPPGFFFIRAFH